MDSASMVNLPIIDISSPSLQTGKDLVDAAEKYGFVFIKNLGSHISPEDLEEAFQISKDFFALPKEKKIDYHITANNMGWSSPGTEVLDPTDKKTVEIKEAFNLGEFRHSMAQQPLPSILSEHEKFLCRFSNLCHQLCVQILNLFAEGLEIADSAGGKTWFSSRHDPEKGQSGSILRLLFYPFTPSPVSQAEPISVVRAGAHSDYGSVTLLFQRPGQPGLEIQMPDGSWAKVPVTPTGTEADAGSPILVNIGDLLSYWTGGLLKSTVHRVLMPEGGLDAGQGPGRYSIAYFKHPANETELVPVPSERVQERGRAGANTSLSGRSITAIEHLNMRLSVTYGWKAGDQEEAKAIEV
ncbi:MAG: hypothetical protein M1814_003071 [Vezdaea aestivalis]|nr:MAG: hypothetical protein M1814_003071 [Vezdaea aestivalis]